MKKILGTAIAAFLILAIVGGGRTKSFWARAMAVHAGEILGEAGRFHACRELMHRLAVQRDCAWENVIRCRELIASFANDPQRSGQRPAQAIGYLRNHVTQIGNLAVEAESVFPGWSPTCGSAAIATSAWSPCAANWPRSNACRPAERRGGRV